MRSIKFALSIILAGAALNAGAQAQVTAYPSKPVSLVIPFAAGGTTDAEARIYTQKLQELTGQPWVFDFRAGAGTTVGSAYVARATPDGYTLLMNNSGMAVFPNFHPDLPFDVLKSFVPITQLSDRVTSLVVSPVALPNVHNLKDLVAHARARPGELTCGTGSGAGGISHIVCESLASAAGIAITPVHYKGAAQAAVDLIAGRTHMNAGAYFNAMPNVKAGKLRVISILNTERAKMLPDMPTAIEQGFDVEYPSWLGVFAPAGMAPALVNRIHGELVRVVRSPDVLRQLDAQGSIAVANTPEAFRKRLVGELARWKKVVQEKGIKVDAGG
jgi:tripartite-type tricarboxylate transporter receptor subunit TctC